MDPGFDVEKHLNSLPKKPYTDGWKKETWAKELEQTALFSTKEPTQQEIDESVSLSALQAIKYEDDNPEDLALEHKDDGNDHFKKKLYRFAIKAYTEGLKQKCNNVELNTILYTNRAAAHFRLGNYGSSLKDGNCALKIKTDHMKAIIRCAECCTKLDRFSEVIQYCDNGLEITPSEKKLVDMRAKALKEQKIQDRDKRKKRLEEKKVQASQEKLFSAIKERNVQLQISPSKTKYVKSESSHSMSAADHKLLGSLNLDDPSTSHVVLDESGTLHWPVQFLFPEYNQSDVIAAFAENSRFSEHFTVMFNSEEQLSWSNADAYCEANLELYFEDFAKCQLVKCDPENTLMEILHDSRCHVYNGTPTFIILSRVTPFRNEYLKQFELCSWER